MKREELELEETVGSGLLRAIRNPRALFAGGFSFVLLTRLDIREEVYTTTWRRVKGLREQGKM